MGNLISFFWNSEQLSKESEDSDDSEDSDNEINRLNKSCKFHNIPFYFSEQIRLNSLNPVFVAFESKFKKTHDEKTPRFAIKPLPYQFEHDKNRVKNEFYVMNLLQGVDSIVPITYSFELLFRGQNHMFLVMNYYEKSDLHEYFRKNFSMPEDEKCSIVLQMLKLLKSLKSLQIVHHDIKLENFLVQSISPLKINLSDFDLSEVIDQSSTQFCGTKCFMAPEVLYGKPHDFAADMWSLGVNVYIMLFGHFPFDYDEKDLNNANMFTRCINNHKLIKTNDNVSEEAWECVTKMLVKDPKQRIKVEDALNLQWFQNIYQQEEKESQKVSSIYLEETKKAINIIDGDMEN